MCVCVCPNVRICTSMSVVAKEVWYCMLVRLFSFNIVARNTVHSDCFHDAAEFPLTRSCPHTIFDPKHEYLTYVVMCCRAKC